MEDFEEIIPEPIRDIVDDVYEYASDIDEWIVLKKQVVYQLQNEEQRLFSKRDNRTKFQYPNEMEFAIMRYWVAKTLRTMTVKVGGVEQYIYPEE